MTERLVLNKVLLACGRGLTRLFRNTVGQAWLGKVKRQTPHVVVIDAPYRVRFGLHPGSADLIGWHSYTIQPDDVGCTVAVFLSVETKSATGRMREGQPEWQAAVQRAGGIGLVVRSVDEVQRGIQDYRPLRPAVQPDWPTAPRETGAAHGSGNLADAKPVSGVVTETTPAASNATGRRVAARTQDRKPEPGILPVETRTTR